MKNKISKLYPQLVKTVGTFILLTFLFTSCTENQASTLKSMNPVHENFLNFGKTQADAYLLKGSFQETLIDIAIDPTQSFKNFRKLDTNFVAAICRPVAITGGIITVHIIGEPTDQSGLRCYLQRLPLLNDDLVLSKRAEMRHKIDAIVIENRKEITQFLKKLQVQIFEPMMDPKRRVYNSDINGFFNKSTILLDEPVSQNMKKIVFCYSDGIQSLNGHDSPACFSIKPKSKFLLCLSGWKTKAPIDSTDIKYFEDPQGFVHFLSTYILDY